MRLAGIEGCVVHEYDETVEAIKRVIADPSVGILLITEKAAGVAGEYLRDLRVTIHTPLITEIPDRHGSRDVAESIQSLISESIGLNLDN